MLFFQLEIGLQARMLGAVPMLMLNERDESNRKALYCRCVQESALAESCYRYRDASEHVCSFALSICWEMGENERVSGKLCVLLPSGLIAHLY